MRTFRSGSFLLWQRTEQQNFNFLSTGTIINNRQPGSGFVHIVYSGSKTRKSTAKEEAHRFAETGGTWPVVVLPQVGQRDLHGGGGLVGADEPLVAGAPVGHAGGAAQRKDDGRQDGRLATTILAAEEVQPLVRHKGEFLQQRNPRHCDVNHLNRCGGSGIFRFPDPTNVI